MIITTNNNGRALLCLTELAPQEQAEFGYCKQACTARFVRFRGQVHDTLDTQVICVGEDQTQFPVGWAIHVKPSDPLAKWHRVCSDSTWSGTLFRFNGNDCVVVASYTS